MPDKTIKKGNICIIYIGIKLNTDIGYQIYAVSLYITIYIYIYIYIYIERERERERERDLYTHLCIYVCVFTTKVPL